MSDRKRKEKGKGNGWRLGLTLLLIISVFWSNSLLVWGIQLTAPSVLLMEASTGQIIYEDNATERRSPASITKIMTLLLTFEEIEKGKVRLEDSVYTSAHAKSMGGSQVYLEEGESQTLETMIKCIVISSGNDASVAVAEHIAGSEEEFVTRMNQKAAELSMEDTHFVDCCGLTDSDEHYSTAKDVAIMSRELINNYPQIFDYTKIWMEDITHHTRQGDSTFTLSSTNKLLKQYEWTTGLKTGSTAKAKYCISATACKDGISLIAVVMGAENPKERFNDAISLLNYGYSVSNMFVDENKDTLPKLSVQGGVEEEVGLMYQEEFRYLDIEGNDLSKVEKSIHLPEYGQAPIEKGKAVGEAVYELNGKKLGSVSILFGADVEKAGYGDYLWKVFSKFLL